MFFIFQKTKLLWNAILQLRYSKVTLYIIYLKMLKIVLVFNNGFHFHYKNCVLYSAIYPPIFMKINMSVFINFVYTKKMTWATKKMFFALMKILWIFDITSKLTSGCFKIWKIMGPKPRPRKLWKCLCRKHFIFRRMNNLIFWTNMEKISDIQKDKIWK